MLKPAINKTVAGFDGADQSIHSFSGRFWGYYEGCPYKRRGNDSLFPRVRAKRMRKQTQERASAGFCECESQVGCSKEHPTAHVEFFASALQAHFYVCSSGTLRLYLK